MRLIEHIETPWAPYGVTFSRDGTRLAIGGGHWYGQGGIAMHDLATRETVVAAASALVQNGGTVSGVAFSANDRHLVASTWRSSQHAGPTIACEVDALALTRRARIKRRGSGWSPTTGVVSLGVNVILRVHGAQLEEVIEIDGWPAWLDIDPAPTPQHLTSARLVFVRGNAVTGEHRAHTGANAEVPAGLVVRSLGSGKISHVPAPVGQRATPGVRRLTAIGMTAEDAIITGDAHGGLDRWHWTGELPQHMQTLGRIPQPAAIPAGELVWATYAPSAVVGICSLANGRLAAVTAGGMLATWRDDEPITTWRLPIDGTPRSIAAHPDRATVAVGIKQGGFSRPASKVALVELEPEVIEPAWRTPRVLEIADTVRRERTDAGTFDPASLGVLADALEEAGAPTSVQEHLRHHDRRLKCCWILDALR